MNSWYVLNSSIKHKQMLGLEHAFRKFFEISDELLD